MGISHHGYQGHSSEHRGTGELSLCVVTVTSLRVPVSVVPPWGLASVTSFP